MSQVLPVSEREGDPTKQPPECKPVFTPYPLDMSDQDRAFCGGGTGTWSRCPNLKETGDGFDGERWECDVCGKSYFLDYDEMK